MKPDFDELAEGTGPEERARLQRAHEALLAAGPPPELPERLTDAPATASRVTFLARRRAEVAFVAAAALVAVAFGIGFFLGDRGEEFPQSRSVAMHGIGAAQTASASILLGDRDSVGNWPMLVRIRGLEPLDNGWYELFLTKDGKKIAPCGTFVVRKEGVTEVRLSIAYDLRFYDGWIVVAYDLDTHKTGPALLRTEEV
jgi:hypothetical protein